MVVLFDKKRSVTTALVQYLVPLYASCSFYSLSTPKALSTCFPRCVYGRGLTKCSYIFFSEQRLTRARGIDCCRRPKAEWHQSMRWEVTNDMSAYRDAVQPHLCSFPQQPGHIAPLTVPSFAPVKPIILLGTVQTWDHVGARLHGHLPLDLSDLTMFDLAALLDRLLPRIDSSAIGTYFSSSKQLSIMRHNRRWTTIRSRVLLPIM